MTPKGDVANNMSVNSNNNNSDSIEQVPTPISTQDVFDIDEESFPSREIRHSFEEMTLRQTIVRKHIHTASLSVLAITAFGFLLVNLRPILIPFVLAIMLTYTLTPIIDILTQKPNQKIEFRLTPPPGLPSDRRKSETEWSSKDCIHYNIGVLLSLRLPRWLGIIMALFVAALIITGVGAIVASSLTDLTENADKYKERVQQIIEMAMAFAKVMNIDFNNITISKQIVSNNNFVSPVSDFLMKTVSVIFDELSNGFLMLLFTAYLLIGYQPHKRTSGIRAEIDRQVKRYLGCKVLLSGSTGVCVGLSLLILRVDLALVFGFLAFLLNFIPNVGSVVATLLPLPVVIVDPSKSWVDAILTVTIPGTIQMVIGNFIEPRVFGKTMELHPVTVLLALMLWGSLWGVVGMILSVPMTAILKIFLDTLDHPITNFCARVMEGYDLQSRTRKKKDTSSSLAHELQPLVNA